MPRAQSFPDFASETRDPGTGEWQALRGELVALLDKVESRYSHDDEPAEPMNGLARRVRSLRDQVGAPEDSSRHREALRTVKRAVDRFSERDTGSDERGHDELTAAIAEIRSRQGAAPMPQRRATDFPELRDLSTLVGGMSQRLERLESDLKTQRSNTGQVREVASQVEQLTQVVELLAGAVGETGQVKRLENQIAALGAMIEDAARPDLSAVNARLDDVSATVGKLAELQAQQMEREIAREQRGSVDSAGVLAPAMMAIEDSVRNVYDRIDAIERSVAMSGGEFERLTTEMAAFTQAMKQGGAQPTALAGRVEALLERLESADSSNGEVAALKTEMAGLKAAVLKGMEPRFARIEGQIEALSGRIVPVDTQAVEGQLKALMARMDDAGAQLDGLARLYTSSEDRPDFETLATMVAERTSDAVARKTPAPVAMFGADSLKSIEDRLTGLIRSAGKTPNYEELADMVAARASEAVARSAPAAGGISEDSIGAFEKRMTALLNTTGKDTAERLARLEAALTTQKAPASAALVAPAVAKAAEADPFAEALRPREAEMSRLDSILAGLEKDGRDAMPTNPGEDAPLIDRGFPAVPPAPAAPKPQPKPAQPAAPAVAAETPRFDPNTVERPPRPRSSFAEAPADPFAEPPKPAVERPVEPVGSSSTSTFVAAARRAQRAKQEQAPAPESDSIIGRALARVRTRKEAEPAKAEVPAPVKPEPQAKPAAEPKAKKVKEPKAPKPAHAPKAKAVAGEGGQSFLARHRRPLLLAATLVAVSMLALNLVLQRMNSADAPETAEVVVAPAANPAPTEDQSSAVPPRVIDMIDPTATGSINPGEPMSFSRTKATAPSTPMPPALVADNGRIALASTAPAPEAAPEVTGSIPETPAAPETFELPPEAVGPLELREAAAKGQAQAQFEVAAIFGEGRAVEQDYGEAVRWYERAAAQGFVPAQYRLGNLYEVGTGVEKDLEQARLWYQRSAEGGNRMAMHNLAALFAGGELGEQQFDLAAEWFGKAAAHGMTDSQFNLGMLYARGLGVDQDFQQSYKWFSLAARSGDADAAKAKDDIAKSLSADAVNTLDAEVAAWAITPIDLAANFAPIGTWSDAFDPGETIGARDVITKVQQALVKLGFDLGTPDGVIGPKTTEAIKAFERGTGMTESGAINPRLLAVLGSQPV